MSLPCATSHRLRHQSTNRVRDGYGPMGRQHACGGIPRSCAVIVRRKLDYLRNSGVGQHFPNLLVHSDLSDYRQASAKTRFPIASQACKLHNFI